MSSATAACCSDMSGCIVCYWSRYARVRVSSRKCRRECHAADDYTTAAPRIFGLTKRTEGLAPLTGLPETTPRGTERASRERGDLCQACKTKSLRRLERWQKAGAAESRPDMEPYIM